MDSETDGNRIVLVTGATGAIGKAIARQIAAKPAYEVVLLCRDGRKAETAVKVIIQATGNHNVRYEFLSVQISVLSPDFLNIPP